MKQNKPDAFIDGFTALLHRGLLALLGLALAFAAVYLAIDAAESWKVAGSPLNAMRVAIALSLGSVAHLVFGIALGGGKGGCK